MRVNFGKIIIILLAVPALLVILNYFLSINLPITIRFNQEQRTYSYHFTPLSYGNEHCAKLYLKRTTDLHENIPLGYNIFRDFEFKWQLISNTLVIAEGSNILKDGREGISAEYIDYIFGCFSIKPFKQYTFNFTLQHVPKKINLNTMNNGVKLGLSPDACEFKALLFFISITWLLMLLIFLGLVALYKKYSW